MSREVDERVVEMQFNNQNFEKNIRTSLKSLDMFKQALDFKGIENSFGKLDASFRSGDFSGMTDWLGDTKNGFSALETIAVGALLKIGNAAADAGIKLVKSVSIDQIMAGWEKFGDKTTSVATLVNQGYNLDEVNAQLDRLNWYTDETSYNFTDMVASIAKFTATGQDLTNSVTAMEGIANWAALSGQNAATASRAMYQLSQALGAGYMRLEDWKSIQNLSMDTDEFREKVLAAAVELKTLQKNEDGTYQSMVNRKADEFTKSQFAQSLTEGAWFTADVMMKVYSEYGAAIDQIFEYSEEHGVTASEAIEDLNGEIDEFGLKAFLAAQEARTWGDTLDSVKDAVSTGWMNTFELIFGNYEEAKTLWTDLANNMWDVFAAGGEYRNEILEGWHDLGGRDDLFSHGFEIDQKTIKNAEKMTEIMGDLMPDLEVTPLITRTQGALWNIFDALFKFDEEADKAIGIIAILKSAFHDIFPKMTEDRLKSITTSIREFTAKLVLSDERAEKLRSTFKGVFAVFDILKQVFSAVWRTLSPLIGGFGTLGDAVLNITADTGEWLANLAKTLKENDSIYKIIQPLGVSLQHVWSAVVEGAGKAIDKLREWWAAIRTYLGTVDWTNIQTKVSEFGSTVSVYVGQAVAKVKEWGSAASTYIKNIDWANVWQSVKTFGQTVIEAISAAIEKLKDWWTALRHKDEDTGLNWFQRTLEKIKDLLPKLKDGFKDFASYVGEAFKTIAQFIQEHVLGENNEGLVNIVKAFIGIKIGKLIGSVGDMFEGLGDALTQFSKVLRDYRQNNYPEIILAIAISLGVLAIALGKLMEIGDIGLLLGSGGVLTAFAVELVAAVKILDKNKSTFKNSAGTMLLLVGFGWALKSVAEALKTVSDMDPIKLAEAGVVFAVELWVMTKAYKNLVSAEGEADMLTVAAGMWAMSKALTRIAKAILMLQDLQWYEILQGALGISAVLFALGGALRLMSGGKGGVKGEELTKAGWAFLEIGIALELLADVIKRIGALKWEDLGKTGAAMAGFFGIIFTVTYFVPSGEDTKKVGEAALAIGVALEILAHVVKKFGKMEWDTLIKAGVAILGFFAIITATANLVPSGKDVVDIGLGVLALSGALLVLVPVLKTLGKMNVIEIVTAFGAIVAAFGAIRLGVMMFEGVSDKLLVIAGSIALIGVGFTAIGVGLLAITKALALFIASCILLGGAGEVAAIAFVKGLQLIIKGIGDMIPLIARKVGEGIIAILETIADSYDALIESLKKIIFSTLEGLRETIPAIVDTALELVREILQQLVDKGGEIAELIFDLYIVLMEALNKKLPDMVRVTVDFFAKLFSSLMDALHNLEPDVIVKMLEGIGVLSALIIACASLGTIAVSAMIGLAKISAFVLELGVIVAAFGGLAQIPGFVWLIGEGGQLLAAIGAAIGNFIGGFVGGVVGGFAAGALSTLPLIGLELSAFAENAKTFFDVAGSITEDSTKGIKNLADAVILLTASELLDGIAKWFTGGSTLTDFGNELAEFAPYLVTYAEEISKIEDIDLVTKSAEAASALAILATNLPNSGGAWADFWGDNKMDEFGAQLEGFATGLVDYSVIVKDLDADAVTDSVPAAEALTKLAQNLPNSGGVWDLIYGENDMDKFGYRLIAFGNSLVGYANIVDNAKLDAITRSIPAAEGLSDLAKALPANDGVWQWLSGDQDLATFGEKLKEFGGALKNYANTVKGIDNIKQIVEATDAVRAIVDLMNEIHGTSGFEQVFNLFSAGDIAVELAGVGNAIGQFYDSIKDIKFSSVAVAIPYVYDLVDMIRYFNNEHFDLSSFTAAVALLADDTVFNESLVTFGESVSGFAEAVEDMKVAGLGPKIDKAKKLIEAVNTIDVTKIGDVWQFNHALPGFGEAMGKYSDAVKSIDTNAVETSVTAAEKLVGLSTTLPDLEVAFGWLTGQKKEDMEGFGEKIEAFGESLSKYGKKVKGISEQDMAAIARSIPAAQEFVDMAQTLDGFTGKVDFSMFSEGLGGFGTSLKEFADSVAGMAENDGRIRVSASAVSSFVTIFESLKGADPGSMINLTSVASSFEALGSGLSSFYDKTKEVSFGDLLVISGKITDIVTELKKFQDEAGELDKFTSALSKVGEAIISATREGLADKEVDLFNKFAEILDNLVLKANDKTKEFQLAGQTLVDNLANGVKGQDSQESINKAFDSLVTIANNSVRSKYSDFEDTGMHLINGFASKIKDQETKQLAIDACLEVAQAAIDAIKEYDVESAGENFMLGFANGMKTDKAKNTVASAARALARRAADAMKKELDAHSPSRVTEQLGAFAGEGFVNGLESYAVPAKNVASNLALASLVAMGDAISMMSDEMNDDYILSPVITPVVDMSNVYAAKGTIGNVLSDRVALTTMSRIGVNQSVADYERVATKNQNADMLTELRRMRNDLNALGDQMSKMQVVMDSGELVGAISAPIDAALGTAALKYRRGI